MRSSNLSRKSNETDISVSLNLDGGNVSISTGIGFFDHMLNSFAVHTGFGLEIAAKGDLFVDCHHTVEDTGIVLGKAFADALGDKSGIARFGSFFIPMDEALVLCSLDISGRPYLSFDCDFPQAQTGDYDCCMTEEFLRAFAFNAGITLHIKQISGTNSHHITEAVFKALAHSLRLAVAQKDGTLSSKGMLD